MLSVLIGVLIICVVGAICFWAIEKFVNDASFGKSSKNTRGAGLLGSDSSAGAAVGRNQLVLATAHDNANNLAYQSRLRVNWS